MIRVHCDDGGNGSGVYLCEPSGVMVILMVPCGDTSRLW
jgi:hypothetical protein